MVGETRQDEANSPAIIEMGTSESQIQWYVNPELELGPKSRLPKWTDVFLRASPPVNPVVDYYGGSARSQSGPLQRRSRGYDRD